MDTFKKMGNTIQENMARIGGSKAGMESLSGEVSGLTTKVDALVNAFSSLVSQLKSLGTGSGVKDMATDVAKVDEGTTKMAQALAKAFGNLNEKKADVKVSEDSLATATNTAAAALKAEEAQAQATAASILRVADSISVATLATKNLYTILGGNREDIAKFLELANTMDMLSRKSAYIMNSGESFSGGKMGAFTEVKKEMEAVQAQMDELKKSGLSGSPIIDSFATAFKNLSEVLTAAGTSVKESTKNLKSLGEGAKNLEKISESQERANRAKNQTTESIQKEIQALKAQETQTQNSIASLKEQATSYSKVAQHIEKVVALIQSVQAIKPVSGNFGMFVEGKDNMNKEKALADIKSFMKSVRYMQDELQSHVSFDTLAGISPKRLAENFIPALKEEIKNIGEALTVLKKQLKTSLGTDGEADIKNRISLLESLKAQYQSVATVLTKHGKYYYDNFGGGGAKDEITHQEQILTGIRTQIQEKEKLLATRKKDAAAANETSSAEDKAASAANANAEAIQKLLTATQELTTATNNLKMAIGSWGQDKGTIATMVAQFEELRKKITQVVEQWEKLAMVKVTGVQNVQVPSFNIDLSSIEPTIKTLNEAVAQLKKSMDLLWESTNRMETSLKAIVTPETFKKVESDAASAKQKVDELSKSVEGMKMQSEKKGSETTLNANLDVLKNHTKNVYEALTQIAVEYEKLSNQKLRDDGLEQRLLKLREYYEWLQKVATMTDTLSKPGALKADATKFNGELLMGKQTKEMWSDKAVKDFQKIVEEILSGRRAAESFETAIQKLKERVEEFNSTGSKGFGGVGAAMETINRVGELNIQTLIKEQGHIERMMKLAEGSSKYMEGHKVAGMDKLQAVQDSNMNYLQTLNRWISLILQNRDNPDIIRFLNTPQSLKLPLPGRADDVAMFNAHYDKLKHSITDTSAAARQLVKDMSLTDANASTKQWNTTRLETGLYNVQDAIQGIMRAWRNASQYADEDMTKAVAQQINRLNAIKQEILTAMTNEQLLGTRHGYASVINPDNTHTLKDSKQMVTDLNAFTRERIKAEKEYNKEVERFTNQSKKAAAKQEQEYQKNVERWQESQMKTYAKAEQEKAKAAVQAQRDIQKEIERTEAQMRKLDSAISRGTATPGRDMTILTDARSKLQGQLNLLKGMTPADMQNNVLVEKRIKNIRTLRDDTDALRKSEERLTTAQQQSNRRSDRADDKRLKDEIKSVNDAYVKYNELGAKLNELQALRARGITANVDVSGLDRYIEYLEKVRQLMKEIYSNNGRTSNTATVQDFGIRQGMLASEALAHNNVKSSSFYNKNNLSQFTQDLRDAESRMKAAQRTAENLGNRIDKLNLVKVDFAKAGIDTTPLQNAIDKIRAIQQELANFGRTGYSSYGTSGKEIASNMGLNAANKAATDSIKKLTTEQRESANAANKMAIEQERLANALNKTSESAKGQSQVLSDLKMMAMQYLSVWGAQSFLNNIIEIGGQLEMQRLSIGAILQNTAHANDLFDKIKAQAIQSPFGVVELDQMTKQLSAYGFQYNELFDMTKRLADISAATGTSVDRLALALGHVRSEAALSGYTLRQFSMANIPLAKKLSEHLSEVEKRFVSVADVRKRVSKKEIGYEDVVNVLKELTDKGGMFYNMQETISQSVKARFKNLHDALDIMFGDIAESSSGDFLKGFAKTLTELTTHWREFFAVAKNVGIVFGAYKLSLLAFNVALGQNNAAILKNVLAYKQKRAAELQNEAMVRKLTAEELALIQTRKKITAANVQVALSTNAVTKGEVLKMVALRKVNLEEAKALIRMGEFTAAEIRMALQGKILGMNLGKAGAVIKLFGQQVGAAAKALVLSPQMWIFALISGLTELWQMNKEETDRAREMNEDIFNRASEGIKNTRQMFVDTEVKYKVNGVDATEQFGDIKGGKFEAPKFDEIDTATAMSIMDKWEKFIKEYASMPNHLINEAYKSGDAIKSLAEQYQGLYEKVIQVANAQVYLKDLGDATEYAENATNGGWFDDSLTTNINDYAKAVRGFNDSISDLIRKHQQSVAVTLKAARADKTFAKAIKDAKIGTTDYAGQLKELIRNQDKYASAYSKARDSISKLSYNEYEAMSGLFFGSGIFDGKSVDEWNDAVNLAFNRMDADADKWVDAMKQKMKEVWHIDDVSKLNEGQKQAITESIAEIVSKASQGTDAIRTEVKQLMQEKFGITIDDNTADVAARVAGLKNSLQDLTERTDWHIQVGTDFESTYSNIKKAYKAAKSYLDSTKPLQMKLQLDTTGGMKELGAMRRTAIVNDWRQKNPGKDSTWLEEYLADFDDHARKINEALDFSKKTGLSLEDEKKPKGNKGSGEDKEAKRLREIAKLYKDAYDWYNKYEKQVGEAGALKKVQAQFQPLFDEFNKTWKTNLTLDSIPTYKKNLTELLDEAMKLYKTPKHKNSYMVEAIKQLRDAISNVDYEEANRQMEDFASKVKIQLDSLTRSWSTFNSVRETTGNADFAAQIARVSYDGNLIQNSADAIRNQIQSYYNEAGGNGVLTFDIELSDEDILKKFQNAIPGNDEGVENYQKSIKGLVEAYKQWRDLQRTVRDDAITAYAKMVTDSMSLKDKIAKINNEYQKTITYLNTLRDQGIIDQPEYAKRKQQAENQRKVDNLSALANSATFEQSFGIVGNVLKNAARELDKKLREEISSEDFKKLTPSQQKSYIEASDKLHSASQTATSPFNLNAWGELMEASRTYKENVNKLVASLLRLQKATIALEQAEEDERNAKTESQRKDAQDRIKKAREEKKDAQQAVENDQTAVNQSGQNLKEKSDDAVEGLENFSTILGQFTQGTLSSFVLAVGNLIKSIKGDGELAQNVGQLFGKAGEKIGGLVGAILSIIDALGDDPTGFIDNLLNKIASVIENVLTNLPQIVGSVIKGAGNIVASAVDGVGGLFGLDFGLSDLFNPDKKLQERIDDLKADVTKIEANTSVLRSLRERSLGYDSGQMRKDIANVYNKYNRDLLLFGKYKIAEINVKYGAAGKAMSEFYSQNLNGNGYSQEYANLLKQRQDYIDMYNAENDKKDSSASAMAEYQSKIAELDEEIMFFTQDLANTLWGIDIKSWANQISDALWNAFENGENAVKAFEKTAKDIVASVAKEMMKLGFIEPLMQSLQKQLFGTWNDSLEMYEGGAIKYTKDKNGNIGIDMQGSEQAVLKVLGRFYGQSEEFAKAGETFYNWVERATGIRFSDNDSALSSNIKGITEDTANILASYINAIRADVAMNRAFIAMFIQEYWISYVEQITSVHTTLRNIDRNVAAMALTFSEAGKIYGLIENISSRLDKFANGVDKISVQ